MVSMLRAMNADAHVKIMRIKNRMSSGFKLCNALHFASHLITSFTNAFIRQRFYAYWNAVSNLSFKADL
jgi:chromosome condensin MukBEF complex kleisin-like MukF subunit